MAKKRTAGRVVVATARWYYCDATKNENEELGSNMSRCIFVVYILGKMSRSRVLLVPAPFRVCRDE